LLPVVGPEQKYKVPKMKNILLKLVAIKKQFKTGQTIIKALDGVSFDIYSGEIISLLGVNGAGKTTLSSILATLHPATSGDILINGHVSIYKNLYGYRHMIGFCPQQINLDGDLTVQQNLIFAGRYMGMPESAIKVQLDFLLKKYGLERYKDSKPDILSGGYARRVLIARSLMHRPQLLILDEPTVGLDPHIRLQLWETIIELKNQGVTVVLTTHYLDEAEFLSDRIVVLDKGKVKLIDTPEGLKTAYQKSRLEDVFIQLIKEEVGN